MPLVATQRVKLLLDRRYDREEDEIPDVFGELGEAPIFVITAY